MHFALPPVEFYECVTRAALSTEYAVKPFLDFGQTAPQFDFISI